MADTQNAVEIPPVDPHNMAMLQGVGTLLNGKGIHEYSIPEQREIFRQYQATPARNPGIIVRQFKVNTSHGEVETFLYKPKSSTGNLPFVYFIHGGGWILGNALDWEEFLFDLVQRTQLAVVFPEYTLAPEKKYPAQQDQCVEVLQHVLHSGDHYGLNVEKVVVACDSVGGRTDGPNASFNMKANEVPAQLASAVAILSHQRSLSFPIIHQILLHPFVHTATTTKVVEMPLTNLAWIEQYYAAYFEDSTERSDILASPDLMTLEQVKQYMPPTTVSLFLIIHR